MYELLYKNFDEILFVFTFILRVNLNVEIIYFINENLAKFTK